ncbi:NACHT domain protein [Lyngbya aestuarii BL J]|uniref:NACHT domain protein n=1 Tax=Lyngbya aestuarii BL J TaxID=1348334 RepID=U7QKS0_9CYAN|nr:NACHT domain-containing NTPase [Lyngbya aestuarii]ERT07710.1 NACHT domain protein [Lyngbya aestuarii BL J]
MSKRSLKTSVEGAKRAKKAFLSKGWTQEQLAAEVNLKTRQPIWRFFTNRPIERHTFLEICNLLNLEWREIAQDPPADILDRSSYLQQTSENLDINVIVQQVRSKRYEKIEDRCGSLTLLEMNHPIALDDIYIDVDILEAVNNKYWMDINEFNPSLENPTSKELERLSLGDVTKNKISGIQALQTYSKLRVLGIPGSGKTTFLQHLAIQCNRGRIFNNRVPIFINLIDFADECEETGKISLLNYINTEFNTSDLNSTPLLLTLLQTGRMLILLDGFDQIVLKNDLAMIKEIRRFSDKYQNNLFVVSCRTAAQEVKLRGFTDVEIAPFSEEKIAHFAQKWFIGFTKTDIDDALIQTSQFIKQIDKPEHLHLRQLIVRPLFLHLACWIFSYDQKFPLQKSVLYKQCLDLLIGRWDQEKNVSGDEAYQKLSLSQKLKLFSHFAADMFQEGKFIFKKSLILQYIAEELFDLSQDSINTEELLLNSEAILKAIELQHGIIVERSPGLFSFSFLAFQEYFTARKIVADYNLRQRDQHLQDLVQYISEPQYREIFLLTASMLRSSDNFMVLIKQKIDSILAEDSFLQEYLTWVSKKSVKVANSPPLEATRAFYFAFSKSPHLAPDFTLACTLDQGILLDGLLSDLIKKSSHNDEIDIQIFREALDNVLIVVADSEFKSVLQKLKQQLVDLSSNQTNSPNEFQVNYTNWIEQLRKKIVQYRNIQHNWNFSPEQQETLHRYYQAHRLLLDCLNSVSNVTEAVRQEIKASLLLSIDELEQREWS